MLIDFLYVATLGVLVRRVKSVDTDKILCLLRFYIKRLIQT